MPELESKDQIKENEIKRKYVQIESEKIRFRSLIKSTIIILFGCIFIGALFFLLTKIQ